jgi:hypothetical protein
MILELVSLNQNLVDELICPACSDGLFLTRSFYNLIKDSSSLISPLRHTWKKHAPPRIVAFSWVRLANQGIDLEE